MNTKFIALALAVSSLAACSPAATLPDGDSASSSSSSSSRAATIPSSSAPAVSSAPSDDGEPTGSVRVVDVSVTDWEFSPATIVAKKGEKVQLRLKGGEGIHSLLVADLGVNIRVQPGETVVVDIPTDKAGTFNGRCGVPCGPGHRDMTFAIVIE